MFPPHVAEVLDRFGVPPETKAVLYDLYLFLGNEVLERFADLCDRVESPAKVTPQELASLYAAVVDHYLRRNHPRWRELKPTASLWHPRALEGRAAGVAVPLAFLGRHDKSNGETVGSRARAILGTSQPVPEGILILGKNAHKGGRIETISFDVVAAELDDALEISRAEGQQHTIPGSIGETSGTIDAVRRLALIWEIQPNVLKPAGDRNREIRQVYRRHRNWHVVTLLAAFQWMLDKKLTIFIVKGPALRWTHELNPAKPMSATIMELHDRTVKQVVEALGGSLRTVTAEETKALLETELMNTSLHGHISTHGSEEALWRVDLAQNTFATAAC